MPSRADSATPASDPAPPVVTTIGDGIRSEFDQVARAVPPRGVSYLYMLAAFVVVTAGMKMAQEIVQLLLLSIFIAVVGVPVYSWLVQKKIASWLALLMVISGLLMTTMLVFWIVMTSLADFTARQDDYAEKLRLSTKPIWSLIDRIAPETQPVETNENGNKTETPVKPSLPAAATKQDPDGKQTDGKQTDFPDADSAFRTEREPSRQPASREASEPAADSRPASQGATADVPERSSASEMSGRASSAAEENVQRGDAADGSDDSSQESVGEGNADDLDPFSNDEFDRRGASSDDWFQPRRVTEPPRTRRSWRELIMSQFDPAQLISLAAGLALSASQILSNSLLILLTVIFILLEASTFPQKLEKAFGDARETRHRYQQIIHSIRSYLLIKTALSILTGVLIAGWLWLFGVPYAGLWGMLAFLLNYIPNIGSIIAAVPALIVAWLDLGLMPCLACAVGYAAVNMGIGNILEPRIMGRGMGLSALVVFCSMVFWGWVLGPVGMLLSVPLTMAVRVALEGFEDTRWLATLLGNAD